MSLLPLFLLLLALSPFQTRAQTSQAIVNAAYASITKNIATVHIGTAYPSTIVSLAKAAPVVVNPVDNRVLLSSITYGKGRVAVCSHESLFSVSLNEALLLNTAIWAAASAYAKPGKVNVAYLDSGDDLSHGLLPSQNSRFFNLGAVPASAIPSSVNLLLTTTYVPLTPAQVTSLITFVSNGGGLIVGGHTWWWQASNPTLNPFTDHPVNKFLANFGLLVSPTGTDLTTTDIPLTGPPSAILNSVYAAHSALAYLQQKLVLSPASTALVVASLETAVDVPVSITIMAPLLKVMAGALGYALPATDQIRKVVVLFDLQKALQLPPAKVTASPWAAAFPGLNVPLVPINSTIIRKINASYTGYSPHYIYAGSAEPIWRSTGVYLPPGKLATVTIPAAAAKAGLSVLVGSHTDDLSDKEEWLRMPKITRAFPLKAAATQVASAFGGLLYIRVPAGSKLGAVTVTIAGPLVRAPWFQLGATTDAAWAASIRKFPAPWAEIASDKLILTVPSSLVRGLSNPTALMTWWGRVLDAHAKVSGLGAPGVLLRRPERFVGDIDISAGYMHSGYPVMGYMFDGAPALLKLQSLKVDGDWGLFHELGHDAQWDDWVLPSTTESTVNIFSVHAMMTIVGKTRAGGYGHPALQPAQRASTVAAFKDGGRRYFDGDAWTTLEMYLQLKEQFGWPLFTKLFVEYRGVKDADRPGTDDERVQQWAWRSSRAAGRDLRAFYRSWGLTLNADTDAKVAAWKLPAWTDPRMA